MNTTILRTCFLGGIAVALSGTALAGGGTPPDTATTLDELLAIPVSTASRYAQLAREAPASVTLVTSEEIERFGFQTLAEAINFVRGFYLSYDRNYSYLGVRGFSRPTDYNNRILLLLNGHAMNENAYESALLGNDFGLDLALVDRIEVVRGPGSALYGSAAVFAVVNVITREGASVSGVRGAVEVGSNRLARGSVLAGARTSPGVDVVASGQWFSIGGPDLYFSQFDTPDNNGGVARRMDWERGVGAACVVSAREWTLQGMLSNRTKGVPTAAFGTRFNDGRSSTEDTRWAVDVGYRRDLGTTARLTGRLSVDGYQYEGSYPYELLQTDASTGLWNGAEVHVQWDTHPFNRLDAGVTYTWNRRSDYRLWNSETSLFSRNAPFDFGSVYLQNSTQVLSNVSLALAARADHHSQVGWIFTPRLAAVYNPWAGGTLKALYGEAFRAPTTYELYYEEPGVQRASPGLKHERSRTWEISVEQRLSPILMLYSSYFDISMHDLIDQAVDPVDSLTQYVNLSEVRSTGVEIELLARWRTGVTISASGSLQSARDGSTDRRLNNSPTTVLKMHGGIPLTGTLALALIVRYESSRLTVYDTPSDPFVVADVYLKTSRIFGLCDASLLVRNVFDARYAYPGGIEHVQPTIPQDGRTFAIRLGVSL